MSSEELGDRCAIVIDVLRATTTIVQALAAGATRVWPCRTVDEARATAAKGSAEPEANSTRLLAGERDCIRVAGFDLGNSPAEYEQEVVDGREIVFTTTNGTAAMLRCQAARRIFLAAFTNLSAVVRLVESEPVVEIVCSGTNGSTTREDVLLAGALVAGLTKLNGDSALNDEARIALAAWQELGLAGAARSSGVAEQGGGGDSAKLAQAFEETLGGRNLLQVGSASDLVEAAQIDRWPIVPEFVASTGQIVSHSRT